MAVDKTKAMIEKRQKVSKKIVSEVKLLVNEYYENNVPIKKSKIAETLNISPSTLTHNEELVKYIKEMQAKQKEKNPKGIDVHYRATAQYRKLMAAYIFTYQLLEEQNSFLEYNIKQLEKKLQRLKEKNGNVDSENSP